MSVNFHKSDFLTMCYLYYEGHSKMSYDMRVIKKLPLRPDTRQLTDAFIYKQIVIMLVQCGLVISRKCGIMVEYLTQKSKDIH
jgi:hypothetical protein